MLKDGKLCGKKRRKYRTGSEYQEGRGWGTVEVSGVSLRKHF